MTQVRLVGRDAKFNPLPVLVMGMENCGCSAFAC